LHREFLLGGTHNSQQIMANVNQTRLGITVFAIVAAASAGYLLARAHYSPIPSEQHRFARQVILYYTFSRVDDPIIVLGDSIVEASTLPRSACGHPIVNAGLNGASTASDLDGWLTPTLANKRAFAIIVSLGTNDALTASPGGKQIFAQRYASLLTGLSKLTTRLLVVEIPPVETRERLTADMEKQIMTTIREYRSVLPEVATQANATFVALPEMSAPFTIDGVHLNAEGDRVWEAAVMKGISQACRQ
jgi:lysophospholipase L1-like esterase